MNKIIKNTIIISLILLLFSSCLKEKTLNELETQQIMSYIEELGLDFDTISSGVLLHVSYAGYGTKFKKGSKVKIIFDGYNLDDENEFITNDTLSFYVGDREILEGWNDLATHFADGGAGIVIFPYDKAYGDEQTPDIPANSTLIYTFRFLSDSYEINQNAIYWKYAEQYDSISTIYPNELTYVKYFDGLGNGVDINNVHLDYSLYRLDNDSLITKADSFYLSVNLQEAAEGLTFATENMYEGEMGKIIIPPSMSYVSDNIYNITPYTALYAVSRVIAADPDKNQQSKIDKYLYLNNATPDSILTSGIYYFIKTKASDDATKATLNSTITYSDSVFILNHSYGLSGCDECTKELNSTNFISGKLKSILMMHEGEEAYFILPYTEAYGISGSGIIPRYATLFYKIKLSKVE